MKNLDRPNKFKYLLLVTCMLLTISVHCQTEKANVVVLGAHPDDADYKAGGTALVLSEKGHNVLFVSVTNGDAGHHKMSGEELAERRKKEAKEAARRFGVKYVVLDNPDGQLIPTVKNRLEIIRLIREWKADMVIGHRPNDYHPDHRAVSTLMQDAAYMVIVPNVLPDVPPLQKNPIFLYMEDHFQKPYPFEPDICIDITDVYEQKVHAMAAHESQYFEWLPWTVGQLDAVPCDPKKRLEWLYQKRKPSITAKERASLIKWYGKGKGEKINMAESFEVCEYGRQPSDHEIREIF